MIVFVLDVVYQEMNYKNNNNRMTDLGELRRKERGVRG